MPKKQQGWAADLDEMLDDDDDDDDDDIVISRPHLHFHRCIVCGKACGFVRDNGTCSARCDFELQKLGTLEHIADQLERIENLLIKHHA